MGVTCYCSIGTVAVIVIGEGEVMNYLHNSVDQRKPFRCGWASFIRYSRRPQGIIDEARSPMEPANFRLYLLKQHSPAQSSAGDMSLQHARSSVESPIAKQSREYDQPFTTDMRVS